MGPDNREVTMATAFWIENAAQKGMPLAEICRRVRLPYWRVKAICDACKVRYRP
jgi:hypothetical protein